MSKLPHSLEAALSFRSFRDLDKRYSKFFNGLTIGYEAEISGGDLGDNENQIDEDNEIAEFADNFTWSEQQFLNKYAASKPPLEVLENFDITPKYGFTELSVEDKKYIITQLRKLDYRVMGLPMQSGDPIMEEPSLTDYESSRWEKESFASTDTRLLNVKFAHDKAIENMSIIQDLSSKYVFMPNSNYAIENIIKAQVFIPTAIKNLDKLESQSDIVLARRNIYTIGHSINQFIKGWGQILKIMQGGTQSSYFFVYDDHKHINMLDVTKYSENGIKSPLLEWSEDGIEFFKEEHNDDYGEELNIQLEEHLSDVRNGLNEESSTVVDKIHDLVVEHVDEKAKVSRGYHNSDSFKGTHTVVEGDSSIEPAGAEVVSPVFNGLNNSLKWLFDVFEMIEDNGLETNKSTGLHVNIGTFKSLARVKEPDLDNPFVSMQPTIDVVKLAILSGDHYLLEQFDRLGNTYAQSLASNIRDLASANFDFKAVVKSGIYDTLIKLNKQFISQQVERYRTINMQHLLDKGYLEFRIAGNSGYEKDPQKVRKAIYRYAQLCAVACDPQAYFKEYMTELYRLFVSSKLPDVEAIKSPRPKNIQEAMYIIRAWSSKYMENGHGALPAAPKDRIKDAIAKGQSAFETDVLDMIAGIDTKLYPKVDVNLLYAIRLLMLYSAKDKPNPKQYLIDNWNKYHDTSIKNYLAPKMYRNKPQWLKFFFTGSMANSAMPKEVIASEESYMQRINPGNKLVDRRPNFDWGDMYGMLPKGAKILYSKVVPGLGNVSFYKYKKDIYAMAVNPDLNEPDVIGYSIFTNNETELHLINSAQGKGIGREIDYLYRKINPYAPSGGFTKEGDRTARKTYHRLVSEKIIEARNIK